jgi:hypothetical protein
MSLVDCDGCVTKVINLFCYFISCFVAIKQANIHAVINSNAIV